LGRRIVSGCVMAVSVLSFGTGSAAAQVFGTFPWQMQPYCNVVTLTLTSTPAGFTLDGSDDLCGGAKKASASGIGVFNPDGTVGVNFTIVLPTGGAVAVAASVSPANGQGTWSDEAGNTGTFAFFGAGAGLPARPLPTAIARRYSDYRSPVAASAELSFDGTLTRSYVITAPSITQSVIDTADVHVWMKVGSIHVPLPYTSTAGGTANTIWAKLELGQIRIYRMTVGCAVAGCLTSLPQSLTYRYSIVTGGTVIP
jgi:hypothetical protein